MTTSQLPESWDAMPYGEHWSFAYELNGQKREDYDFRVEFDPAVGEQEEFAIIHLLEAAPKLLEALAALVHVTETMTAELDLPSDPSELVTARNVLAKARGENAEVAA